MTQPHPAKYNYEFNIHREMNNLVLWEGFFIFLKFFLDIKILLEEQGYKSSMYT